MADEGSQTMYSTGRQCLVSNAGFQEIFYEVQISKSLFGKLKSSSLVLTGGNASKIRMPEAVLVKKLVICRLENLMVMLSVPLEKEL